MKEMRLLGNIVHKLSIEHGYDNDYMCKELDCTKSQYLSFLSGRLFLSFEQLTTLANLFSISVDDLMKGDNNYYEENYVHCMGEFENIENREMILDIIDDYLTLLSETRQNA